MFFETENKISDCKKGPENNKAMLKLQQRFRRKVHNLFIEKANKISLNGNYDKRILKADRAATYLYAYW